MAEDVTSGKLPPVRFAGKVDAWFYLLVVIGNLVMLGSLAPAFDPSTDGGAIVLVVVLSCLVLLDGLTVPMLARNYVEFDDAGNLRVAFGWRTCCVPVEKVGELRETDSPLASTAASLDRVSIQFGVEETTIAVKDKDGFFRAVEQRCPNATVERTGSAR